MKYIHKKMNEAVRSLGAEDTPEGRMLSKNRPEIYACQSIDEVITVCERLFKQHKFDTAWTKRFIHDLFEIRNRGESDKKALEDAVQYVLQAIPTPRNEFKARERTVGFILAQHTEELSNCKTVDELIRKCRDIFHEAADNGEIDEHSPYVTGFLRRLELQRMHNDIEFAWNYVYTGVILPAQKLSMKFKPRYDESESKPKHSREEIEEAIEFWKNKLRESEDDQDIESDDSFDNATSFDDEPNDPFTDLCLEISLAMKHNGCYSRKCLDDVCEAVRDFLIDEYGAKPYDLPDVKSMDLSM